MARILTGKRLDDVEAKKIADAAAAFDKRFKDQTAAPGSEAAVRRMINELQTGEPNYDLMSPGLAEVTRQQLPQLQSMIAGMGALQAVIFRGVGPGGADIYHVNFEKGSVDYHIWLGTDGKAEGANLRPSGPTSSPAATHLTSKWWKSPEAIAAGGALVLIIAQRPGMALSFLINA